MTFSAVILAGGRSLRMGRDKAFLMVEGRPLIERGLATIRAAGAAQVFISARPGQEFALAECPVLPDRVPNAGPLAGIERALALAEYPWVLVLAVDLPEMTADCLQWLAGHCREGAGVLPVRRGQPEPLAAFYPRRARALVERALGEGRLAVRDTAEECVRKGMLDIASVPSVHEPCFANWNTPEDIGG